MKKDLAIVFGITKDYSFALANVLIGMKKHCKVIWNDIIVYNDGLSRENKEYLNSILPCTFIVFDEKKLKGKLKKEIIKEYSLLTMARFECFDLLKKYKKVIWHDVDILVQGDFSGLMNYANKSGLAMTLTDSNFMVEQNFFDLIKGYEMLTPLYNAGIIVFSDRLSDFAKMSEYCYAKVNELGEKLRYMDQGVLNLLIQDFKIEVEDIDILKYCCHPNREEVFSAIIVHAYGKEKFWNSPFLLNKFPEWERNNNKWEKTTNNTGMLEQKTAKKNPLVTVLMTIYEKRDFIKEAIESILNQTYTNIEFLIIVEYSDSQNEIVSLIEKYNDKRIKIIKNSDKLGFTKSLNYGLDIAKGTYIARMDDDDISIVDRIEKQVFYMEQNQNLGIVGGFIEFFMNSSGICYIENDYDTLKAVSLFRTPLYHPTVMMRKKLMDENNLRYDVEYFTEDYELWTRALRCFEIENIPEVLVNYRASGQNITAKRNKEVNDSHLKVMKKQIKECLDLDLTNDELQTINARFDIKSLSFNSDKVHKLRLDTYTKVFEANIREKFCTPENLKKVIGLQPEMFQRNIIKRIMIKMLDPLYNKLMFRIEKKIDNILAQRNSNLIDYIDKKIISDLSKIEINSSGTTNFEKEK